MAIATLLALAAALAPRIQDPAPPPDAPPPDPPCRISGAFVDEAGLPIAGVTFSVSGTRGSAERVERFGLPQGWQNPAPVTSGDDGKFSVSFVPPRAFGFTFFSHVKGFENSAWMHELEPGQELDLGAVALQREAVLVGHILDAEGNLLVDNWLVTAFQEGRVEVGIRLPMFAQSRVDPATGQFRIEGLPPGNLSVRATDGTRHIAEVAATTKHGSETFLELHYGGPDAQRRLVVSIGTRPFHAFRPGPGAVQAIAEDGTRHTLTTAPGRSNDWHLVDVEPGTYRIEIRDPRFDAWTQEVARTGQPTSAQLVGSAALRLAVVDGTTGARVEAYSLDVGYRNVDISPAEFRVRERTVASPVGGLHDGIVPGDLTLAVEAEGFPTAHVDVDALAPGETRDVTVTLSSGLSLSGRVVDSAGRPLAGVDVQVTRGEYPGHDRVSGGRTSVSGTFGGQRYSFGIGYRDDATTSAADGSFSFRGLSAGTHALLARRGQWNEVWTKVELPRAEPIALALPDAASTSIRLLLPDGESPTGLRIARFTQPGEPFDPSRQARSSNRDDPWTCDAEGRFAARYLPLGTSRLDLVRDAEGELRGFGSSHERLMQPEVTIASTDATELELDLRETFPVFVTLLTPLPAVAPEAPWMLSVELIGEGLENERSSSSAPAPDGQRRAHTQWVLPGTYRVQVSAPGLSWARTEPVQVVRGAPNVFDLAVPLVGRELRILRVDGAPLANSLVEYWTDPERHESGKTDAQGRLVVVLLAGTLTVEPALVAGPAARATAAFGPGEGPLELRLRAE
jgi:hypothetical protein